MVDASCTAGGPGIDAGVPERFSGVDVSHAGQHPLVEQLAQCVDPTDCRLYCTSQQTHVSQILEGMERDGVDDEPTRQAVALDLPVTPAPDLVIIQSIDNVHGSTLASVSVVLLIVRPPLKATVPAVTLTP